MSTPTKTELRTRADEIVNKWRKSYGIELDTEQLHALLFGVVPDILTLLEDTVREARIDELNELDLHYWGDDDVDVYMNERLKTYLPVRLVELKEQPHD